MNASLPAVLVSFVAPALVVLLLLITFARFIHLQPHQWKLSWRLGLTAGVLGMLCWPLHGLPLARWLAGIVDHWSVPLLALLATAVAQKFFGIELLWREDRQAGWVFGAVSGATLYPFALGLGPFDPFSRGWHFGPLFVVVGIVAVILHWRRNRFGVVLFLAVWAWWLRLPESRNFWDCLVDPFYFLASLGALGAKLWRGRISQPEPPPPPQC